MPGTLVGATDKAMDKTDHISVLMELESSDGDRQ